MFDNVVASIIGGIAAILLIELTRRLIWPLLSGFIEQVPLLRNTTWTYHDGTFEITSQIGARIKARATRSDGERIRHFNYNGKIVGGQLLLTWEESRARGHIFGTMILNRSQDGQRLEGMTMYYSHQEGRVISVVREYTSAGLRI